MYQSKEEIFRIFDEWGRNFAPANFIQNEKNAKLLAEFVLEKHGVVSISGLNEAMNALASQLDWVPQPKPKTQLEMQREFEAKELARIQREKSENSKPFNLATKIGDQARKDEGKRLQEQAEGALNDVIKNVELYAGPNRVDHGRSVSVRDELRKVVVRTHGKRNPAATLTMVRQIINELPSEATAATVQRLVRKLNQKLQDAAAKKPQRDSLGLL